MKKKENTRNVVVFRPACASTSGMGHLKRCISIANGLPKTFSVAFAISYQNRNFLSQFLERLDAEIIFVGDKLSLSELSKYPEQTRAVVLDIADNLHVANKDLVTNYLRELNKTEVRSVVIDGIFSDTIKSKNTPSVNILIKPYIEATSVEPNYGEVNFIGEKAIILGNEYSARTRIKNVSRNGPALITFGGSDPDKLTEKICDLINKSKRMRRQRFIVVLGANFNTDRVKKIQKHTSKCENIELVQTQPSLREIYESRFAIIGSGATTRYEAAICGLPVLILSATPKHDNACKSYEKFNCAKYLSYINCRPCYQVESAMLHLIYNNRTINTYRQNALKLKIGENISVFNEALNKMISDAR